MHRQYSMLSMLLVNSATKTCHDSPRSACNKTRGSALKQRAHHVMCRHSLLLCLGAHAKAYGSLLEFLSVILSVTGIVSQHVQFKC